MHFNIQEKNHTSVPDATISQNSFKIVIETKLSGKFNMNQLEGHLQSFGNEDYMVLLTLDPEQMEQEFREELRGKISEFNRIEGKRVAHEHLTFEELINAVEGTIDDRDFEMLEVLEDYRDYCYSGNLIPNSWKKMRVQLASNTFDIAKELGVKWDKTSVGFSKHDYLGLYRDKSVRAIGKIKAVAIISQDEQGLNIVEERGHITQDLKDCAYAVFKWNLEYNGFDIKYHPHRYFFVGKFYDTDFVKTSKGAPWGSRVFDLCEVLDLETLPEDIGQIAERLRSKTWI
jgi:hypothetical protein